MAPLLGRKPFPLVKPPPGEERLFTIAHTQEAFRTREYPCFHRGGLSRAGPGWSREGAAHRGCSGGARARAAQLSVHGRPLHPAPLCTTRQAGRGQLALQAAAESPASLHSSVRSVHQATRRALCPRASLSRLDPVLFFMPLVLPLWFLSTVEGW